MRGPHTFVFINCRNVTVRDVSFVDSANYAIFFQISDHVDIRNVKFTGGWDGVHFRGAPSHPCKDVSIVGCRFYTGDDSIAGRYWENVVISDCIVNSSCNGIRLIGPATHLIVRDCLFYGPGVQPHRTLEPLQHARGHQPPAGSLGQDDRRPRRRADLRRHDAKCRRRRSIS